MRKSICMRLPALNTTPEWLTSGIGPEERAPSNSQPGTGDGLALPLAGVVAAGVWTEVTSDKVRSTLPPKLAVCVRSPR
jgi:hypothetical protein